MPGKPVAALRLHAGTRNGPPLKMSFTDFDKVNENIRFWQESPRKASRPKGAAITQKTAAL